MKSKTCAYCKREFFGEVKRTAEHIFPQTLLQLYPEQDVSFTPEKIFKDNSGLTIADVCAGCNNGALSELDSYGGELIKKQFKDEIDYDMKDAVIEKTIEYDVCLINGQKYNVKVMAERVEEEIMEKDLVKLQGGYDAMDEDSLQDNFLNVSKLNLKTFLDGTEMMEDSLYEGQMRYIPEEVKEDKNFVEKIVYVSPIRHAEGNFYLSQILAYPEMYEQMLQVLKEYDEDIISINYDDNERRIGKGTYKILSKSNKKELPLNVYGYGMKKAILLMSAVIAAKDGILLLDEFETAIHTSAMNKTFKWIIESCKKLNVQVFMTSHSKEAIDKVLKCSPECIDDMAVYTLYKDSEGTSVRRLDGKMAIEAQDEMGLELR